MKVIRGFEPISLDKKGTGVALGNFDGLHIGHMALINTMLNESYLNGYTSCVYTFFSHPEHLLRKKFMLPLIMHSKQKINFLSNMGIDILYLDEFDENFSKLTPREFVKDILAGKLYAKLAVVGFNYRFGYKGKGNAQLLKKLGNEFGFKVIIVPPVKIDNEIVSSTIIRKYILKGDVEKAFQLLGRHFSILGTVVKGKQLGSKIGFPTANMRPRPNFVVPSSGVYATRTLIGTQWFSSITNIGYVPTLKNENKPIIETHIFNFDRNIYGEEIEVFFLQKIRDEKKFSSKEELIKQIKNDIETIGSKT